MKQADREDAFHIISQIRDGFADGASRLHKANEATTRLIIIDEVLNALGWSKDDFNPETKAGQAGYIDYLLSIDRIPRLIIEAKRTGKTFGSPSKNSPRNTYQLRYFRSAFKAPFTQVIKQAQKYALETGIPYAMITNGAEWVLVQLLLTPGYNDINDLRGYYFGNLFSDEFNFELFWEILHKPYVDSGSLESSFAEINIKEADFNRTLGNQFGLLRWQTLEFNQELRYFYDLFFDEIIDPGRRNMLEKCFVTDSRLDQYQGELKRALRDIAPSFIPEAIDITPGEGERLVSQPSGDQKGRVIIVTGRVGCGKSTFVTRVLVKARHDQKESLVALKIDLIDEVENGHQNVTSELWRYITRDWKQTCPDSYHNEVLRKIFGRELSELRRGPYEKVFDRDEMELARHEAELLDRLSRDPDTFFPRCWKYYRKKAKGIVVFLDNADQASEPYQKKVYAFAHKLARETGATVIITMREFTFFRGREAGFLDVRSDDTVFHLKSPDLLQLLSKRIKYIEHYIDEDHRSSDWKKNWDWDRFRQNIRNHSNTLKQVFLVHETGTDFLALLSAIAWHDVRFFLNILRQLHFMLGSEQSPWSRFRDHSCIISPYRPGA